jgi:hypothetical protein
MKKILFILLMFMIGSFANNLFARAGPDQDIKFVVSDESYINQFTLPGDQSVLPAENQSTPLTVYESSCQVGPVLIEEYQYLPPGTENIIVVVILNSAYTRLNNESKSQLLLENQLYQAKQMGKASYNAGRSLTDFEYLRC